MFERTRVEIEFMVHLQNDEASCVPNLPGWRSVEMIRTTLSFQTDSTVPVKAESNPRSTCSQLLSVFRQYYRMSRDALGRAIKSDFDWVSSIVENDREHCGR